MLEINKLYYEDCLEGMKKIDDRSIDFILCDLPYGTTKCKWDVIIPFDKLWKSYERVIKDGGAIVLFGSQPFSSGLVMSNLRMFKYSLVWDKNKGAQPALCNIKPMQSHEDILIFGNGRLIYNPQFEKGEPYERDNGGYKKENNHKLGLKPINQKNNGFRYPKSILKFPRDFSAQTRLHPTQKPISLCEYLIKTYSLENDLILDNCAGSGSTLVAAKNLNRRFLGFENNLDYYEIACERIGQTI